MQPRHIFAGLDTRGFGFGFDFDLQPSPLPTLHPPNYREVGRGDVDLSTDTERPIMHGWDIN